MWIIDFIIGATLVNAVPHIIAWIWSLRMAGGFGYGSKQNFLWGLFNFGVSVSLFVYQYGVSELISNKIYLGAFLVVSVLLVTGRLQQRFYANQIEQFQS